MLAFDHVPAAYRRAGRVGDGWLPQVPPGPQLEQARALVHEAAVQAGREPAALGCEGRVGWTGDLGAAVSDVTAWRDAGASHLSVNTMNAGLSTVDDHLAVLSRLADELGLGQATSAGLA